MEPQHELQRDLGFWSALTIGAGTMIGAGIFLLAGRAIELAGPGAVLSYLLAGVVCMLTAAAAAELATGMPTSGGDYYFVSRSLGAAFGAVSGVGIWLSLTVAIAFYLVGTGEFLAQIAPVPEVVGALGGAALLLVLNVVGAKVSGSAQIVVVVALLVILAVFVVGGTLQADPANLTPFLPEGGGAVLSTTALVFVSFLGFVKIAAVAEEVKDPSRNLPRALIGSVALVTVLYVLVVLVVSGVFTQEAVRDVPDPLTRTARLAFGGVGATGIIVAGLLATLSSANASILAASRINLAMSRDGLFPGPLAAISRRFVTPLRAIVLTSLLAATLIVVLPDVEELAKIASSLQLYSYAAINVGCVALRAADPDWYRPTFRVPLTPLPQLVGALGCLAIIGFSGTNAQLAVVALVALSLLWYALRRSRIDFETAVPQLRARWHQLGLRALFAPPSAHTAEATSGPRPAPLEHIVGPGAPRRVAVALANPDTETPLLVLARLIATGAGAPGAVLAVSLVPVPRQTPLTAVEERVTAARRRVRDAVAGLAPPDAVPGRPVAGTSVEPVAAATRDVADGLVEQTLAGDADLLLLGWHGGFSLGRIANTPVRRVVAALPADLAVLKDRGAGQVRRILVPWGGGRHARLGLELALRVAAATGARVELLRAVRDEVDQAREEQEVRDEVASLLVGQDVELDVLVVATEDVTSTIIDTAEAGEHDLLVIGASGESGLRSVLFGTIPDVVADAVPCSVLLVRRHVPEHWAYRTSDRLKRLRERAGLSTSAE